MVRDRAARILKDKQAEPNMLHRDLVRLFRQTSRVRLITTNYDDLVERAATQIFGVKLDVHNAPSLPPSSDFTGVVHVHGNWNSPSDMVLTGTDYGRAYLVQGRSREFIAGVFADKTVLFVGYSHNDIVVTYLSSGIRSSSEASRYALTSADDPRRWRALGTKSIVYDPKCDHRQVSVALSELADVFGSKDEEWRTKICQIASKEFHAVSDDDRSFLQIALKNNNHVKKFCFYSKIARLAWLVG